MAVKTEASLEPGDSAAMAGLGMVKKKVLRVWFGHVHPAIIKMDTNRDLLYSTGNSAQCHVAA